jgi:uncharacterized repeat protein (TIGR03803 family)
MKTRFVLFIMFLPVLGLAQTYTLSTLASFPPTVRKGPISPHNLIIDSSGNLYGSSTGGGKVNLGTVYEITPAGVVTVLHSFGGTDGSFSGPALDPSPVNASLSRDSKGNIYGTTPFGGTLDPTCPTEGCGTVFKMARSQSGTYTLSTLYSGSDGQYPTGVVLDPAGNLFGLSAFGGAANCGLACPPGGSLFEITTAGTFIDLHDFCDLDGEDGCNPTGTPTIDSAGNLYGITFLGGFFHDPNESEDGGYGVVFSWSPISGTLGAIRTFTGADCEQNDCDTGAPVGIPNGAEPLAKLTLDAHGNFYGTTAQGGIGSVVRRVSGYGTVFMNAGILYEFCQQANCADGSNPSGKLILDSVGNIYGVAPNGGANGHGVVFTISSAGVYRVIYNGGSAGVGDAVVMDKAGNLYGTTLAGGASHNGSIYKLTKKN